MIRIMRMGEVAASEIFARAVPETDVSATVREIIADGQKKGELRTDCTASEIIKAYAMWERALMYDWCLCGGEYSLVSYSGRMTPMFLESFRSKSV